MSRILKVNKKILKTGDYTYMITLPKEWVKKLKWRAKQMVRLEFKKSRILVKGLPKKKRKKQPRRRPQPSSKAS